MKYFANFKIVSCILLLITLIVVGLFFRGGSDAIQRALPHRSKIHKVYRSGYGGNGDYVYALKASISMQDYLEFVRKFSLSNDAVDPFSVIGFNGSIDDLPESERDGWDEPESPELKYFKMNPNNFVRATYDNGYLYYFSRGW